MTLPTLQYFKMKQLLRGALSVEGVAPSDADVLNFFGQLFTDSAGAPALSSTRQFSASQICRAIVSGDSTGPVDADVTSCFQQLQTDSAGLTFPGGRYQQMKNALRAAFSCDSFGPSLADILSYFGSFGFGGNFGALLPGGIGYWRSDLGLHTTGSIVNQWDNQLGTSVLGNIVEGTATVGIANTSTGINGHAGILGDGATQFGKYASPFDTYNPSVTNTHFYAVYKAAGVPGAHQFITGDNGFALTFFRPNGTSNQSIFDGSELDTPLTSNTWARARGSFTGTATSTVKWGTPAAVTGSVGNGAGIAGGVRGFLADQTGANKAPFEVVLFLVSNATLATFNAGLSALDAAVASFYGAGVQL